MCATVFFVSVHSPTCAPRRAAAYAASHPACPAPITMTSKFFISHHRALATPEGTAEHAQQCYSLHFTGLLPPKRNPRTRQRNKFLSCAHCHGYSHHEGTKTRSPPEEDGFATARSNRRDRRARGADAEKNILCGLCDLRG